MMHSFHFVSYPVYLFTLIILLRETSKVFQTYKYYIIVHVISNVLSESFVSFMMLPVAYLPHPMFRTTGLMADYGFSGLFQFYILIFLVSLTLGSIIEMFYFRFKVCIVNYADHKAFKWLRIGVNFYRFLLFFPLFSEAIGFKSSIQGQQLEAFRIHERDPSTPPEVTCYSCVISLFDDWVTYVLVVNWTCQFITAATSFSVALHAIKMFIIGGETNFSRETIKLQRILLFSLFVQVTIHGILIGMPVFFMIYAIFYNVISNDFALVLLLLLAYHGFVSTCAMILFTKPLRDKLLPCLKRKPKIRPIAMTILQKSSGENPS